MSKHFSYEIDERNLRVQLKNLEVPHRTEAWSKFEVYADAHPIITQKPVFAGFDLKLSRQVVMPAIFGAIIILFSFLLYNFVSIKKDKEASPALTEVVDSPEILEAAAAGAPESPKQEMLVSNVVANTSQDAIATPSEKEVAAKAAIEKKVENPIAVEEKAPIKQDTGISPTQEVAQASLTPDTNLQKKKRRRQEEEAVSALKPTMVSEEEAAAELPQ